MKALISTMALAVGLVACTPAPTQAEAEVRTELPAALHDLLDWQPTPYPDTDRLPPDYSGLDIWRTKDLLEIITRYTLRQHDNESDENFQARVAENNAIAPFDYSAEYAFLANIRSGPNKSAVLHACQRLKNHELLFNCMLPFRRFNEYHPRGVYGRQGDHIARVHESFNLSISLSDLLGFQAHLRLHDDEKEAGIVIETADHEIHPDHVVGMLIVGKLTSPFMEISRVTYETSSNSWPIMAFRDDGAVDEVPYVARHYSIPFSPTRLVAYVIETGEIVAEVPWVEYFERN